MPCQALQQGYFPLDAVQETIIPFLVLFLIKGEEHLPFTALLPAALAKVAMDVLQSHHTGNVNWKLFWWHGS